MSISRQNAAPGRCWPGDPPQASSKDSAPPSRRAAEQNSDRGVNYQLCQVQSSCHGGF